MHPLIIVIDDSITVRTIIEKGLRCEGYDDVCCFADGVELLRWLKTPQARIPALMLVDLMLPKIDGYTLIRCLKKKPAFAHTIFVILSGQDEQQDKLPEQRYGANAYMTKPFQTQDIAAVVESQVGSGYQPDICLYERAK